MRTFFKGNAVSQNPQSMLHISACNSTCMWVTISFTIHSGQPVFALVSCMKCGMETEHNRTYKFRFTDFVP